MFRLETFGGLALTGGAESSKTPRRRLALLVLLAAAGERGLSRDKLQAYLWPESAPDNARHALEQLLYAIRRQLGDDVFSAANPVALNAAVIGSDIADFRRAMERGAPEEAIACYRGPFLDGFFLSDAPEFERWADAERARLAQLCMRGLEALARRDAERDPAAALEWWRRLVAMDPYATGPTLGLMDALATTGDRAGALEAARVHRTLVEDELGAAPSSEVAALAEDLRTGRFAPVRPGVRDATPLARPAGAGSASDVGAEAPRLSAAPPGSAEAAALAPPQRGRRPRRVVIGAVALGVVALAGWAVARSRSGSPATGAVGASRVVIAPFRVSSGDSGLAYLREGMVDLLSAELTGEDGPTPVDARTALSAWWRRARAGGSELETLRHVAHDLGAGLAVTGEVVPTGGSGLVLSGALRDMTDGRVRARATVRGVRDSLPKLVDQLAASLLALHAGESEPRLASLASASLPALRAYLAGRTAYRRGENVDAIRWYARALEWDSTFALAGLELASAAGWVFNWTVLAPGDTIPREYGVSLGANGVWQAEFQDEWARACRIAWKGRARLGERDQAYLRALLGDRFPEASSAAEHLTDWESAVRAAPDRADAWYRLGLVLLYQGGSLGIESALDQAAAAFSRALALDPGFIWPTAGLLEIAGLRGDSGAVRRLGAAYLAADSVGQTADYVRWRVAAATDDSAALRAIRGRFPSFGTQTLDRIQWTSQVEGVAVEDGDRALALLVSRAGERFERAIALFNADFSALNRGRPAAALRLTDAKLDVDQDPGLYDHYCLIRALYADGDTAAGAAAAARFGQVFDRKLRRGGAKGPPALLVWDVEQWRFWRGDTAGMARALDLMQTAKRRDEGKAARAWLPLLEAMAAVAREDNAAGSLVNRADSVMLGGCCDLPHYGDIIVARLHERLGDRVGALRAIRREEWYYPPEFLATSLREEGRLAALTGDRDGAIRAYRHFLALRAGAEASRRADVDRVRAELKRLERAPA